MGLIYFYGLVILACIGILIWTQMELKKTKQSK